jgi:hypothetical protein
MLEKIRPILLPTFTHLDTRLLLLYPMFESIRELRRISDMLGIEPERLGLAASLYLPKTPEMVEEIVDHVWALMDEIRVHEAFNVIEKLVQDLHTQIKTEDYRMLTSFAHALHAAGYVASMRAR